MHVCNCKKNISKKSGEDQSFMNIPVGFKLKKKKSPNKFFFFNKLSLSIIISIFKMIFWNIIV